jgi:hypothetical protein
MIYMPWEEVKGMYSRRNFLVTLVVFISALLAPSAIPKGLHANQSGTKRGKFVRQGWVLQEGDV